MKASSESGECASLISTGSFPVFEAACRPAMGLLNSSSVADPNGRGAFPRNRGAVTHPGLSSPQRQLPVTERLCQETNGRKQARRRGLRGAWPGDSCRGKPSISAAGGQTAGRNSGSEQWTARKGGEPADGLTYLAFSLY